MSGASPGRMRSVAAARALSAVGTGEISTKRGGAGDHRLAQAEEQDGHLLAEVAGQRDEDGRRAGLVDGGPGQPQHHLGGEPVAELCVDRVGADDPLGQLGPGVGRLVGEAGPADERHGAGSSRLLGRGDAGGGGGEGLAPADRDQLALLAQARLDEAPVLEAARLVSLTEELAAADPEADDLGGGGGRDVDGLVGQLVRQGAGGDLVAVDRLVGEAALVAEPAVVDRIGVDAEQTGSGGSATTARRPGSRPSRRCRSTRPDRGPRAER